VGDCQFGGVRYLVSSIAAFEEERKRKQTVLFPMRLDDRVITAKEAWAAQLRARNIGNFRHWRITTATKRGLSARCVASSEEYLPHL
jgi:hypothetical protein